MPAIQNRNPFKSIAKVAMLLTQSPADRRGTELGLRIEAVRIAALNPLRALSNFAASRN